MYEPFGSILFKDSTILTNEQSFALCDLVNLPVNKSWSLLYRASRDGFKAIDFHTKVNGVQNTLTIVKTTNGYVFGGFTTSDWGRNYYLTDSSAFIFSFINNFNKTVKMNVKSSFTSYFEKSTSHSSNP